MRMLQTLLEHMPPAGQGTNAQRTLPAIRHTKAAAGASGPQTSRSNQTSTANGNHMKTPSQSLVNGAADEENKSAPGNKKDLINGHVEASSSAAAIQHEPANGNLPRDNGRLSSTADEGEIGEEVCIGLHLEHSTEMCNEQVNG